MKKTKVIIGIMIIIIIGALAVGGYFLLNKNENIILGTASSTSAPLISNYDAKIYFIDNENIKKEITENQIIKYDKIYVTGGEIKRLEKDGKKIKYDENEALEEGKYTVKLKLPDGKIYAQTFFIDKTPPVVTGFKKGASREKQTIIFDNIEDIAKATLRKKNVKEHDEIIDLLSLYKQEKLQKNDEGKYIYTINESGIYILTVADEAENTLIYNINIRIK